MNELEDLVRSSMEQQVQQVPPMNSPGDHAIGRAHSRQRRNAAVAVLASVLVLALAVGTVAALRDNRSPSVGTTLGTSTTAPCRPPSCASVTATIRPDLLVDRSETGGAWRSLLTSEGHMISLAGIADAGSAYRIHEGWLVMGFASAAATGLGLESLWLVTQDGSTHQLIDHADSIAIAPDGARVAWRAGNRLIVGHLAGAILTQDQSTPAPPRGAPIAYTGTAVILGYTATGGGLDQFDTWLPGRGDYSPSWNSVTLVVAVYQPAPDGSLYGLVRANSDTKSLCLAQLDPANNLAATRKACDLPLTTFDTTALISPDGRWMAKSAGTAQGRPRVDLVDLNHVFDSPAVIATWDALVPVAWVDATTLVLVHQDGSLSLARVGRTDLDPITVSGQPTIEAVRPLG